MYALGSLLVTVLIPLVSSAYVGPRDECYNIPTLRTYTPPSISDAPYTLSNTFSVPQCQVAITSWLTTTVTAGSLLGYLNSSVVSSVTTSPTSTRAVRPGIMSTTRSASNTSPTTSSVNVNSLLSEFASIYSVLSQYEYHGTANSSTPAASGHGSFHISVFNVSSPTSYTTSMTANSILASSTCGSSCRYCTTIFRYVTTTITATSLPPSPTSTLPPITVGNVTYTPSGAYYVIGDSTLLPGGSAILVSNSTLVSLSPSGTKLVIAPLSSTASGPGPSTYELSPASIYSLSVTTPTPTSTVTSISPKAGTIVEAATATITGPYNLPVLIFPSQPILIAGTTLTPGAPAVTIHMTPVSLAPSSDFLVVGSSTITLAKTTITSIVSSTPTTTSSQQLKVGSMIWSGIGGTEPGTSATSSKTATSALATSTSIAGQVYKGAGTSFREKASVSLWFRLGAWALALQLAGLLS